MFVQSGIIQSKTTGICQPNEYMSIWRLQRHMYHYKNDIIILQVFKNLEYIAIKKGNTLVGHIRTRTMVIRKIKDDKRWI